MNTGSASPRPEGLRALSFLQPWLWAILEEHKGFRVGDRFYAVENRSRPAPRGMLGQRFALHASRGHDRDGRAFVMRALPPEVSRSGIDDAPRGALVGTALLAGAVQVLVDQVTGQKVLSAPPVGGVSGSMFEATGASPWAFGAWVYLLTDIRRLSEPVPVKGMLGFWRVPEDIADVVRAREVLRGR
jgi:hypothetical protein